MIQVNIREEQNGNLTSQSNGPGTRAAGPSAADRMALAMHGLLYVYFHRGGGDNDPNGRSCD